VARQCERVDDFADYIEGTGHTRITFSRIVDATEKLSQLIERAWGLATNAMDNLECFKGPGGTDCASKTAVAGILMVGGTVYLTSTTTLDTIAFGANLAIEELELAQQVREAREPCDELRIESDYVIREKMRELAELQLEGVALGLEVHKTLATLEGLRNDALGILATKQEQLQQTIDLEAARTDPNVRIYRNSAIRQADRTFAAAVREAYRATLIFEYYTSTSFARRGQLPLVRMVAHGDYPLEQYLDELDDAFYDFEDSYGIPDLRVDVLSVADDVLAVPKQEGGRALRIDERLPLFQDRLAALPRNEQGALVIDFTTSLQRVSPLTHSHKVRFVEVEFVGDADLLGDDHARVYVRQTGEGAGFVRDAQGTRLAYSLPQRTAVVNVFVNTDPERPRPVSEALGLFEGSVVDYYRSERLRDRPLHHSGWQLVFDQANEHVNRDIQLEGLQDIRIHLWHTDFTEL